MTELENFEAFMRNYQDMVFSTAVRLVGNDADAQDIAQNVFLKAYERFAEIAQSPAVSGWLKTVATNLSLNHLSRYRARWRFFSELRSEDSDTEFIDLQPAPDTFTQDVEGADERRLLEAALQKLPDTQRVPLVLYHFEDLGYDEIAARLDISLSKVKTDIHRGREALRKVILRQYPNLTKPDGDSTSTDSGSTPPPRRANRSYLPQAASACAETLANGFTNCVFRLTSHA